MTDSAVADHAAPDRSTRRALLGAGVIGAVLAAAASRTASASAGLSDTDLQIAQTVIAFELAARDLYDAALEADADNEVLQAMREQHESYAQLLAGISGISADARHEDVFANYADAFGSGDVAAALEVENGLASTHVALCGEAEDVDIVGALASIAVIESRHAVALATLAGEDDLDTLLVNPEISEA